MRKRGFTLIEVLIALVIFVVGALAVIRIFPPAFNVVQNSGYNTVATRLSDSILTQMKGDGSTPDAVFDIDSSGNWAANLVEVSWKDQDRAVVGTSDTNGSLPKSVSAYSASALNHFKYVHGESHYIQNSAGDNDISNAPYLLTSFPYTADSLGGVHLHVSLKISGVTITTDGRLDFSRATYTNPFTGTTNNFHETGTYAARPLEMQLNSTGGMSATSNYAVLLFRSPVGTPPSNLNTGARFYISYSYIDGISGKTNSVVDESLNLPNDATWNADGGSSGGLDPLVDTSDCNYVLQGLLRRKLALNKPAIISGGVQVTARAELIFTASGTAPTITTIGNGSTPSIPLGTDQIDGTRGFVKLPSVFNGSTPPGSLMPNTKVSADYLVMGWNTLFNQTVSDSNGKVYLPVKLLDSNFAPLGLVVSQNTASPAVLVTPTSVDNQSGQVTYGNANVSIRTVYQGLDQWNSQISPAAESYVPFNNDVTLANFRDPINSEYYYLPREPWREYLWTSGSNTVYFHANEAGKTVQVKFIPTGSTQPIQKVLTIDPSISAPAGVPAAYASTGFVSTLELKDSNGNAIAADGILGIRGLGIIARTAWLNGNRFQQSVVTGYRTANAD